MPPSFGKDEREVAAPGIEIGAIEAFNDRHEGSESVIARRVLRKTDMVILPMMVAVFFVQYLDKQMLSYASVYGLISDLHMVGTQYSWCSSIFFIGQFVSEYPFIYLLSRFPLNKFVAFTIIVWGGVCMCQAAPKTFGGYLATRFFLGFTEGAVSPAFITLTSIWYRRDEHPMRIGAYISANAVAQVIGSLLMYGIGQNSSYLSLAAWRVSFIVCGALTVLVGIIFWFLMPTGPDTAWFLTADERVAAAARLANTHEGGDKTNFSISQFKEAMLDWKTFSSFCFGVLVVVPGPIIVFASLVIKNLGYTAGQTLLYGAPGGAVQLFFVWVAIIICQIFPRHRAAIVIGLIMVPLVGSILMLVLPISADWGVIVGAWLGACISPFYLILLSLNASNIKGNTKRSVANVFFYLGYTAGGVAFPFMWSAEQAPRYINGITAGIVGLGLLILQMVLYGFFAVRENKRRDRLQADGTADVEFVPGMDITDKEDLSFRYQY